MNREAGDFVRSSRLRDLLDPPHACEPTRHSAQELRIAPILRRRAKLVAGVSLVGAVLVTLAAVVVPPSYMATAQIQVEPTEAEIAAGLLGSVVDTHITTMTSEARLREVIAKLPPRQEAAPPPDGETGAIVALRRTLHGFGRGIVAFVKDAAGRSESRDPSADPDVGDEGGDIGVGAMKAALLVRQERQSNVLSVSYRNADPRQAALMANRIVTTHVEELQNRRRLEADRLRNVLEGRIEATRDRLTEAEEAARSFYAARGAATGPGTDAAGSTALEQELAYVRASLEKLAASETAGGAGSSSESDEARSRAHDIRLLTLQAAALQRQLDERRTVVGGLLGQQIDRQEVEGRMASIRRSVEDLERRRDEVADRSRPYAANASIFALAPVPSRPSSISPLLMIPPGLVAFALLGCVAAVVRERMDHSFRTTRDAGQSLGIPCLCAIPKAPAGRRGHNRVRAYRHALGSVALGTLHATGRRRAVPFVLVTAERSRDEAAGLAEGLATAASALGRRVLLLDLAGDASPSPGHVSIDEGRTITIGDGGLAPALQRDPSGAFDRAVVNNDWREVIRVFAGDCLDKVLDRLSLDYDLVLVDGLPVITSMEIRLLAMRTDAVILALAWGRTRREAALDALDALRESAALGGSAPPNVLTVLTGAPVSSLA